MRFSGLEIHFKIPWHSLELKTFSDLFLQVHDLIEQILQLQVKNIHSLLRLRTERNTVG